MFFKKLTLQWAATLYVGGVSFGLNILIARSIGPATYGQYAVALAVGAMLSIILDGGFRTLLIREKARSTSHLKQISPFLPSYAFGHALVSALVTAALALFFSQNHLKLALATIAGFLGIVLSQQISALLRGGGRFGTDAGWQIGNRSLSALLMMIVILAGFHHPWQILSAWSVGTILACVIAPYGIKYWPRLSFHRELYKSTLPLLWINLATAIYFRFDMVALRYLDVADKQIGQYAAAYRLIEAVILVTSPVSVMLFRRIRLMEPGNKDIGIEVFRATTYAVFIGFVCALAVGWLAFPVIHWTYGNSYPDSVALLSLLAWALVFLLPNAVLTQAALAMELQRPYAVAATVAAGFNVLFNLFMIRHMGTTAAAIATIFTEALLTAVLAWNIFRKCRNGFALEGNR